MKLFLGIDLGTSFFKVGLFDEVGLLHGLGRVAVPKSTPFPDACEVPVEQVWALLRQGLTEALVQAGARSSDIAGLSYSSQANSFVLLDAGDRPLTPLVVWKDLRVRTVPAELAAFGQADEFARVVGFRGMIPELAVVKWAWFRAQRPELWARARRVMTLSDYLTFELTGERVGDSSTASLLGLFDLRAKAWWGKALQIAGVSRETLSVPLAPGTCAGRTTRRASDLLGLPSGIPYAVGGLDHHVAALGGGLGTLADVSISTGTVLAAISLIEDPAAEPGCYHGPHVIPTRYYRLAFDSGGTEQIEELRRGLAPDLSISKLIEAAASVGVGRDEEGSAAVAARRFLERIASSQRSLIGRVLGALEPRAVVANGGLTRSTAWLQLDADLLGVPVIEPTCTEAACLGAAMIGGVGAGVFTTFDEAARKMVHVRKYYFPCRPGRSISMSSGTGGPSV